MKSVTHLGRKKSLEQLTTNLIVLNFPKSSKRKLHSKKLLRISKKDLEEERMNELISRDQGFEKGKA